MEEQTSETSPQIQTSAPGTLDAQAAPQETISPPSPESQTTPSPLQPAQPQKATASPSEQKPNLKKIIWATGRRKTAVAQVRMVPSKNSGKILVNKKSLEQYFQGIEKLTLNALSSLRAAKFPGSYDFFIKVHGGGIHSQSDAIRHAIARALAQVDPKTKQLMRKEGYLTRDPRVVERKKSGQPKARKRFQYSKR